MESYIQGITKHHTDGRLPPPTTRGFMINNFVGEFLEEWAEVNINYSNVIALGDFNIHMNEQDPDALLFKSDLDVMGLKQWVSFATHQQGHLLDLIITESDNHLNIVDPSAGDYISDHRFVHSVVNLSKPTKSRSYKTIEKLQDVDIYDLCREADLGTLYSMDSIDDMVECLEQKVQSALQKLVVKETKLVVDRKKVPWMMSEVKEQHKIMRNRERIWKKYGESHQWQAFKREQKRFKSILRHAKSNVLTRKILDCGKDKKKLFSLVFNITGTESQNPMPESESNKSLVQEFSFFFMEKIQKIVDGLSDCHPFEPESIDLEERISRWSRLSEDYIKYLIRSMPNKQSEIDTIPTVIMKKDAQSDCEDYVSLCGALSVIFTKCIEQGEFPTKWKNALVKSLLKGKNLDHILKNYRPVSNLTFISKVLEKVILTEFSKHMESHNLLPDYQSAYR